MAKLTKKQKEARAKVDKNKVYTLDGSRICIYMIKYFL